MAGPGSSFVDMARNKVRQSLNKRRRHSDPPNPSDSTHPANPLPSIPSGGDQPSGSQPSQSSQAQLTQDKVDHLPVASAGRHLEPKWFVDQEKNLDWVAVPGKIPRHKWTLGRNEPGYLGRWNYGANGTGCLFTRLVINGLTDEANFHPIYITGRPTDDGLRTRLTVISQGLKNYRNIKFEIGAYDPDTRPVGDILMDSKNPELRHPPEQPQEQRRGQSQDQSQDRPEDQPQGQHEDQPENQSEDRSQERSQEQLQGGQRPEGNTENVEKDAPTVEMTAVPTEV